jgi:hypothetical protein
MGDTLRLLGALWSSGTGTSVALVAIRLAERLVPAATASVVGLLVSRVTALNGTGGLEVLVLPLAAFGVVLFVSHAAESVTEPLAYLTQQRIDGAHRTAVTLWLPKSTSVLVMDHIRLSCRSCRVLLVHRS